MPSEVTVTENPDAKRYEARLGDEVAGFIQYLLTDEVIVFTHTQVDPAYEGRGIGGTMVRKALDDVAAAGTRKVMPLCPFVKAWIGKHPEYEDLVYHAPPSVATD